ncbi:AbrB/MazE/SpoVT family DNA-binding domain-containing protein [Pseudomonas sp. LB3P93]
MATATVNSRGQITIPADVRAAFGLHQGDRVELVELEGGQFAMVVVTQSVHRFREMIQKPKTTVIPCLWAKVIRSFRVFKG